MSSISLARSPDSTAAKVCEPRTRRTLEPRIGWQPHLRDGFVGQRLIEAQRIGDAPAREGIDDQTLLVLRDDFFRRQIEDQHALVEIEHVLERQGSLEMQARAR